MLRAVDMSDEDFVKPQICVASSWNEITPCNLSLDRLAKAFPYFDTPTRRWIEAELRL